MLFTTCLVVFGTMVSGNAISSKMDFGYGEDSTSVANNSSTGEDDIEVKQTLVTTKLKNSNRRGLHADESGALTYNIGRAKKPEDIEEVPVVKGYKSVETTQIRTPDSRFKSKIYPDSMFINRNIRDDYDVYPNIALNPTQWKPSNFFNNINWWSHDASSDLDRKNRRNYPNERKLHRGITDDGMKEFYCRKCMELSNQVSKGCTQQRSYSWNYETTTSKVKIDGKLAKLN